ncbi:MAG: CCA tRNA nucleotidyltransferase [Thermoprotei archaeon]|jgi:tRNA nucleotidyltransferase (CCA-adding enzyme)
MGNGIETVLREVEKRVTPSRELVEKIDRVKAEVFRRLQPLAVDFKPELEGSVAKGTWLATDPELDVFMMFPTNVAENAMVERVMEVGKTIFDKWEVSYAEHPYVRGFIDDVPVDLVPCYAVSSPLEMISAVDRTPFHTRFVNENLNQEQKKDVRLLKAFLKGLGIYGAEIKTRGFSGYASEVLVYRFGSFLGLLDKAQRWRGKVNLGWNGQPEALGVPDPIDPSRNVTASVSMRSLSIFVAASGFFLRRPSLRFFWGDGAEETANLDQVLILKTGKPSWVDDVLWGEIWRAVGGIRKQLIKEGFAVIDVGAYEEADHVYFFFYLLSRMRATVYLMEGPPVNMIDDSIRFVDKWSSRKETVRGPWVGEGKWFAAKTLGGDARDVIGSLIKANPKQLALGDFEREVRKGFEVEWGNAIANKCSSECLRALRRFALLRETWALPRGSLS